MILLVLSILRPAVKVDDSGVTVINTFRTYRLKWTEIEKFGVYLDTFWTKYGIEHSDPVDQGYVVTSSRRLIKMEGARGGSRRPATEIVAILNDRLKETRGG
ncbi:MAG: PH domain-containing protein [Actinomycetota bacterium]